MERFQDKKAGVAKYIRVVVVSALVVSWVFSGWPQIFDFPPQVKNVYAVQFGRPDSDVSIGSWTGDPVNTSGNRYQNIDETTASDTDFVRSENNPSNSAAEFGLSDVVDPQDDTGHVVRYRYRKMMSGGGQPGTIDITAELLQTTTVIASQTHNNVPESTWTAGSFTLTSGEAGNITDYADLRLRFTANKSAGTRTSWGEISWAEFEVPDAPPDTSGITQRAYLFENDDGSVSGTSDSNTSIASANTPLTDVTKGERMTVRIQIDNTGGSSFTDQYQLQYEKDGDGKWNDVRLGGSASGNSGADLGDWNAVVVDDGGGNNVGEYTSLTIGTDGFPVISYRDATNSDLMVAKCSDAACAGTATVSIVDSASTVNFPTSIAISTDGFPVISYRDDGDSALKVAKCNDAACSGGDETISTVDSADDVGHDSSIAIGADDFPVLSYYDLTNGNLKAVKCGDAACSSGNTITTVDNSDTVGEFTSIAIDPADGFPIISYYDFHITNAALKVAKCGDASCSSGNTLTTVESGGAGDYSSISIGTDGLPVISYWRTPDLKVVKCGNAACSSGNTTTVVDAADVGSETAIAIGQDGFPVVAYRDTNLGALKIATCDDLECAGQNDTLLVVDNPASTAGRYSSVAIGEDGFPVVSYYDTGNSGQLKVAKMLPVPEIRASWGLAGVTGDTLDNTPKAGACGTTNTDIGVWHEATGLSNSVALGADACTELAYMVDTSEATVGVQYRLRLVISDGTALGSYAQFPTLTIVSEANNDKRYSKEAVAMSASSCGAGGSTAWDCRTLDSDAGGKTGQYSSLAVGTDGYPVLAYGKDTDASGAVDTVTVVKCNDAYCVNATTTEIVDATDNGSDWISLAVGTDGNPVLAYHHFTDTALRVLQCSDPACSNGTYTVTTVDSANTTGVHTSIAIGLDGFPVIAYHDDTNGNLLVAKCNDLACAGGDETTTTVDSGTNRGIYVSLAIGSDGFPVMAYYEGNDFDLVVTKCGNAACSSGNTTTVVDSADSVGSFATLAIGTDGNPVIAYRDQTNDSLKVVKCNDAACSGADETFSQVDDTANTLGDYASLALGPDGNPVIAHYDRTAGDLRVVSCNDAACSGGDETILVVDDTVAGSAANTSISLALTPDGRTVISYYDDGAGALKFTKELGLPKTAIAYFDWGIGKNNQLKYNQDTSSSVPQFVQNSPLAEDGLLYRLDDAGYTAVATQDSSRDAITSASSEAPALLFIDKHSDNTISLDVSWVGQSSVAASTNSINLEVFRFGSTNAWETVTTNSTCAADADCTIDGSVTVNVSEYYFSRPLFNQDGDRQTDKRYSTFWRVTQATGTQTLGTDLWEPVVALAAAFEQVAYRWFSNSDSANVGSSLASQDTATTLSTSSAKFRLRLLLGVSSASLDVSGQEFTLQFADKGGGTCASPGEAYANVTGTTAISYFDNPAVAGSAALAYNDEDPTDPPNVIINQTYQELSDFTNSEALIDVGQNGKWDFSLHDNGAPDSTTYCFRAVKTGGTLLDTYTKYPEITTGVALATGAGGTGAGSGGGTPAGGGTEGGGDDGTEGGSGGGTPSGGGGAGGGDEGAAP